MTLKFAGLATLALAITTVASSAGAQSVEVTSSGFSNAAPVGTIANNPNGTADRVCWGSGASAGCPTNSNTSLYTFNQVTGQFTAPIDEPFQLGTFQHINNPITGIYLESVRLVLSFNVNGTLFSESWTLTHQETPNATPCAYPSNTPCADRVTFALTNDGLPITTVAGGYTINILGFGPTANNIQNSYITQEGITNTTFLWAEIGEPTDPQEVVPEPATMTLLATGLAGMAAARRRRKGNA